MRLKSLIGPVLALAAVALSGCGGGSDTTTAQTTPGPGATVISGVASKGPITGTVKAYAIKNGAVDTTVALGEGQASAGSFTVNCGTWKGPVMLVASGTFKDELTGATVTLKSSLEAAVPDATTGTNTAAVTPLTDLASKKAKVGGLTPDTINSANKSVGSTFGITGDVVTTLPDASGSSDQKKHSDACGTFSQMANDEATKTGKSLDDALQSVMSSMESEVEHSGGLSDDSRSKINTAATEFSKSGKGSGGTATPAAPTKGVLKISTTGNASVIGAVDMTIKLPAGVTVPADATGQATVDAVAISGVAAVGSNKLTVAKFTAASGGTPGQLVVSMINATGFGIGECLTINFDMAAGTTFPAKATDFAVTSYTAKGLDSTTLSGVNAGPSSLAGL